MLRDALKILSVVGFSSVAAGVACSGKVVYVNEGAGGTSASGGSSDRNVGGVNRGACAGACGRTGDGGSRTVAAGGVFGGVFGSGGKVNTGGTDAGLGIAADAAVIIRADGGASSVDAPCIGACCPVNAKCYSVATKGPQSPGAECLATHENDSEHIQLRQSWIYESMPVGNASPIVYGIYETRSEFPAWDDCNMSAGASGYMQLEDLFLPGGDTNIDNHLGFLGNAKFFTNADIDSTLANGLCFIDEAWKSDANDPAQAMYALGPAEVGDGNYGTPYPPGLPAPMAQKDASGAIKGWHAGPSKGKRVKADFELQTQRAQILARFAPGGDLAKAGFQGLFFYDSAKGYVHAYWPLSYRTNYDNAASHVTVPIREAEQKIYTNDPTAPNCVGVYKSATLVPGGSPNCDSLQDPQDPSWSCKGGSCPGGLDGPATTDGYYLITEIEQVYAAALAATLCVTYPTKAVVDAEGFFNATEKSCETANWDPSKADGTGMPKGDWCSATNSPATTTCHDAWRSHAVQSFSGANLKDPTAACAP